MVNSTTSVDDVIERSIALGVTEVLADLPEIFSVDSRASGCDAPRNEGIHPSQSRLHA